MIPRKVGKPRKNIIYDDNGNIVDGLSFDNSTLSYIVQFKDEQGKKLKKTFGRNKAEAIGT